LSIHYSDGSVNLGVFAKAGEPESARFACGPVVNEFGCFDPKSVRLDPLLKVLLRRSMGNVSDEQFWHYFLRFSATREAENKELKRYAISVKIPTSTFLFSDRTLSLWERVPRSGG
jgi:hypothetical protein